MAHPSGTTSPPLAYSKSHPRWAWKMFLLGLVTPPAIYITLYLLLRVTGIYHLYFSQGRWHIACGTGMYVVGVMFYPPLILETDAQNKLRWLEEPTKDDV